MKKPPSNSPQAWGENRFYELNPSSFFIRLLFPEILFINAIVFEERA
jgi:hypothetical protein